MPQSLANVVVHVVFATRQRRPSITHGVKADLHAYLACILRNERCSVLEIGGVSDHVHVLFQLNRTSSLSQIVEKLKTSSSKWMKADERSITDFAWQGGYGAFSVSHRDVESVASYIRNQEAHHKKATFQEEYRRLLSEFGIEFDERYVWD